MFIIRHSKMKFKTKMFFLIQLTISIQKRHPEGFFFCLAVTNHYDATLIKKFIFLYIPVLKPLPFPRVIPCILLQAIA